MFTADRQFYDQISLEAWNTGKKVRVAVIAGLYDLFDRIPHATPAELRATMKAIYNHVMTYSSLVHDLTDLAETNVTSLIIEWAALLCERAGERKDKLVAALGGSPKFVGTLDGSFAWEDAFMKSRELIKACCEKAVARELK